MNYPNSWELMDWSINWQIIAALHDKFMVAVVEEEQISLDPHPVKLLLSYTFLLRLVILKYI